MSKPLLALFGFSREVERGGVCVAVALAGIQREFDQYLLRFLFGKMSNLTKVFVLQVMSSQYKFIRPILTHLEEIKQTL